MPPRVYGLLRGVRRRLDRSVVRGIVAALLLSGAACGTVLGIDDKKLDPNAAAGAAGTTSGGAISGGNAGANGGNAGANGGNAGANGGAAGVSNGGGGANGGSGGASVPAGAGGTPSGGAGGLPVGGAGGGAAGNCVGNGWAGARLDPQCGNATQFPNDSPVPAEPSCLTRAGTSRYPVSPSFQPGSRSASSISWSIASPGAVEGTYPSANPFGRIVPGCPEVDHYFIADSNHGLTAVEPGLATPAWSWPAPVGATTFLAGGIAEASGSLLFTSADSPTTSIVYRLAEPANGTPATAVPVGSFAGVLGGNSPPLLDAYGRVFLVTDGKNADGDPGSLFLLKPDPSKPVATILGSPTTNGHGLSSTRMIMNDTNDKIFVSGGARATGFNAFIAAFDVPNDDAPSPAAVWQTDDSPTGIAAFKNGAYNRVSRAIFVPNQVAGKDLVVARFSTLTPSSTLNPVMAAFDASTGALVWATPTGQAVASGNPVLMGQSIVMATLTGVVQKFSATDSAKAPVTLVDLTTLIDAEQLSVQGISVDATGLLVIVAGGSPPTSTNLVPPYLGRVIVVNASGTYWASEIVQGHGFRQSAVIRPDGSLLMLAQSVGGDEVVVLSPSTN